MGFFDSGIDWAALQGELPNNDYDTSTNVDSGYTPDFAGLGNTGGPANMASNPAIQKILDSLKQTGPNSVGQPIAGSVIQRLLGKSSNGTSQADLASILGAFSQGEKANRVVQGNFTQDYDKSMLAAQGARNNNESDALKKLAQTSYIMGGGSQFKPPTLSLNGKTYNTPDLGFGPKASSDAQKAGASTLQSQLQARLMPGGSYTPQPLDDYAKPGLAENLGSYGAAGVGGLGAVVNALGSGGGSGPSGAGSSGVGQALGAAGTGLGLAKTASGLVGDTSGAGSVLSGVLGKALPIAGAATGIYGMLQNKGLGSNVLSGMGTGASIGSIVPGLGTLVGGGIGALAGGLESLFTHNNPSQAELAGRGTNDQGIGQLTSGATPDQWAEAQKAGWADPKQALAHIMMRDAATKGGLDPQAAEAKASQLQHGLWDSEKGGANAEQAAFSPIQSMMGGNGVNSLYGSGGLVTDAFSKGARG